MFHDGMLLSGTLIKAVIVEKHSCAHHEAAGIVNKGYDVKPALLAVRHLEIGAVADKTAGMTAGAFQLVQLDRGNNFII